MAACGITPLERYTTGVQDYIEACFYGSATKGLPSAPLINCPHIGAIWFLMALFIAMVEFKLCMKVPKAAPFILIAGAAFSVITRTKFWLPFDLQPAFIGAVYVYLGYWARQHGFLELRAPALVNAVLVLVWVIGCLYTITVSLAVAQMGPYLLGFPVSLCSSFLVLQLSHWIADHTDKLKKFLLFFGVNSLVILCFHLVFLDTGFDRFLLFLGLTRDANMLQAVNLIIQLSTCALAVVGIKKTRFLKKVFY